MKYFLISIVLALNCFTVKAASAPDSITQQEAWDRRLEAWDRQLEVRRMNFQTAFYNNPGEAMREDLDEGLKSADHNFKKNSEALKKLHKDHEKLNTKIKLRIELLKQKEEELNSKKLMIKRLSGHEAKAINTLIHLLEQEIEQLKLVLKELQRELENVEYEIERVQQWKTDGREKKEKIENERRLLTEQGAEHRIQMIRRAGSHATVMYGPDAQRALSNRFGQDRQEQ